MNIKETHEEELESTTTEGFKKGAVIHAPNVDEKLVVDLSKTVHLEAMITWLTNYTEEVKTSRVLKAKQSAAATKNFQKMFAKLGIPAGGDQ